MENLRSQFARLCLGPKNIFFKYFSTCFSIRKPLNDMQYHHCFSFRYPVSLTLYTQYHIQKQILTCFRRLYILNTVTYKYANYVEVCNLVKVMFVGPCKLKYNIIKKPWLAITFLFAITNFQYSLFLKRLCRIIGPPLYDDFSIAASYLSQA